MEVPTGGHSPRAKAEWVESPYRQYSLDGRSHVLMDTCKPGIFIGGKMKKRSTRKLVAIGVLASVASVLMFLEFPLWFAPGFYEMDLSEIPVLVGAFAYGPIAGLVIEAVKILVKTAITGTITMGVGELANFLVGAAFIIPATCIYYRHKTRKTAIIGLVVGVFSMVIIGSLLNAFVLLPAYAYFLSTPEVTYTVDSFVYLGSVVNPLVKNLWTFILFAVAPFNLVKGVLDSVVVILIYKRISMLIKSRDRDSQ